MSAKFRPFSDLDIPTRRRRNLPHWEVPGATYFLTFRLADSMPAGVVKEFEQKSSAWLQLHGLTERREVWSLPAAAQKEFRRLISAEEKRWLDSGAGCCVLRNSKSREWVIETLHHSDGIRYTLDAYVIMPNHVHLLVLPSEGWSLTKIVATWKQFSARRINLQWGKRGALWQKETFDHIVRDRQKLEQCRQYVAANPVKAKLRQSEYQLGCGFGIGL